MPLMVSFLFLFSIYIVYFILAENQEAEFRVMRFTHTPAFPADRKWTHIQGVKHIIARADDGNFYEFLCLLHELDIFVITLTRL